MQFRSFPFSLTPVDYSLSVWRLMSRWLIAVTTPHSPPCAPYGQEADLRQARLEPYASLPSICTFCAGGGPEAGLTPPPPPCAPDRQVADLRQAGLEPYAYRFDRTHYTSELQVGAGDQGGQAAGKVGW